MKYILKFEFTAIYHAVTSCCHALSFHTVRLLDTPEYGVSMSNLPGFQAEFCRDMRVPLLDLGRQLVFQDLHH